MDRLFDDLSDDAELLKMLRLRKELDPGAPDAVVIDPPRTDSARRRQALIEWKAQVPSAELLAAMCPHGNMLA